MFPSNRFAALGLLFVFVFSITTGFGQDFDAAVVDILAPRGNVNVGQTIFPQAIVANLGPQPSPPFPLIFAILASNGSPVYGPTQTIVNGLPPGLQQNVAANQPWIPNQPGEFLVTVFCNAGDRNPQNDTLRATVGVAPGLLSRQQAIALVQQEVIAASPYRNQLVAFLYNNTATDSVLHNGDVVSPWDNSFTENIPIETYLFWLDYEPEKEWLHASAFVFVDARSGALLVREAQSWPVINAVELTHFTEDGNDSPDRVHGNYPASNLLFDYKTVATNNKADWAVLVVGRNLHGADERKARVNDLARIKECLNGVALGPQIDGNNILVVPGANTNGATIKEVCDELDKLKGKACRKLFFYYIGHGEKGGMILKKEGKNESETLTYEKLACKLLELGVQEVCIVLETCYSGSAIPALQGKEITVNGKKLKLKGAVVTSSPGTKPTTREADGAPFNKAMHECCKDPNADLNKDGKVTIIEAVAWGRSRNPTVASDGPQGATLGDGRTVTFPPPYKKEFTNGEDAGGTLHYEVFGVYYKILKAAAGGKDSLVCRQTLYVENRAGSPHVGGRDVEVVCFDSRGRETVVHRFKPMLDRKQRICLTDLPANCNEVRVRKARSANAALAQAEEGASLLRRGAIYARGEFIFQEIELAVAAGQNYKSTVTPLSGWGLSIDPLAFTASALLDTEVVLVRGVMPDTATQGNTIAATVINTSAADTAALEIHALLFDSLDIDIGEGQTFLARAVDLHAGLTVNAGTLRLEEALITFKKTASGVVKKGGKLIARNTTLRPEEGATYNLIVRGALEWEGATLVAPRNGLRLESPSAQIFSGGVLLSQNDGLALSGDQSQTALDFFLVDGSAANGVVCDSAANCTLRNLRVENSGASDVVLRTQSNVTMLDCAFDANKTQVDDGSQLTRAWTTQFLFANAQNEALPGVIVEVRDANGSVVGKDTSEASGFSEAFALVQYRQAGATRTPHTPHQVKVSYAGRDTLLAHDADAQTVREIVLPFVISGVAERDEALPTAFALEQNHPNPFGAITHITYALPEPAEVTFSVYNVMGQMVKRQALGRRAAGRHTLQLEAAALASGVYFYELAAGRTVVRKKLVVR